MRGILWMLLFTFAAASLHVSIRHLSQDVHPFEIAFFRSVFGIPIILPWLVRFGLAPLKTRRLGLLTARGLLNTFSMLAFFWGLSVVPVANATALAFTAPVFATLLALVIYREKVGLRRAGAIIAGFSGVLIILRPVGSAIGTGELVVLCSALSYGFCIIMVKALGRTESSITIATYMSLVIAPMALVPALFVWTWPSAEQWAWLVFMGLVGTGGQMAMTEALKVADTHVVMPIDFVKLIWVAILGYLAFSEFPDIFVWIGGILIFSATIYIAWREHVLGVTDRDHGAVV
jgi:drug/metabolite transporter (DMT)-like permease